MNFLRENARLLQIRGGKLRPNHIAANARERLAAADRFVQAAAGLQQAGKDVQLTANELAIVDCAFKATGVTPGDCETRSPTDFSEQQAKADADDDDDSAAKKKPSSKKKKTITTEEPGCTAASSDPGSLLPIFAALAAIRMTRRRRGNFSA